MSVNIRILPSGRDIVSEGKSTLLDAGLRSGLALGYGCSNGNCGQCLARIISGEVRKVQHHDYVINDLQKREGHVLMCCNAAVSDVVLEAVEAHGSNEIPQQQVIARTRSIEFIDGEVAQLHLKTPRSNRLRFLAGQYVQLGGNNMPKASHSISSCPCDDMNLYFHIPRNSGEAFSDHIFEQLKKGDSVHINGPKGDFVLDDDPIRPLVFIAFHTGFAPIRSLIEHAIALDFDQEIRLLWIAGNDSKRYQENLCRSWRDALDNFVYIPVDTKLGLTTKDDVSELEPVIHALILDLGNPAAYDFYIAGGNALSTACKNVIQKSELPVQQLKVHSTT